MGLKLSWIKGYNSLPVMLAPSAFDAKPVLRDRGTVDTEDTHMPFFRESMRIGEEDRQQLLTLIAAGGQYIQPILTKLFDDAAELINGALVIPEVMIWELLQNGTIAIAAPNSMGINVNYNYNYDTSGDWTANNIIAASVPWGTASANPVGDILGVKRKAAGKGIILTRAVMSMATWSTLIMEPSFVQELDIKTALSDAELRQYLTAKTGLQYYVNEKMYKDYTNTEHAFVGDDRVIFMPSGTLGNTYYGTTPEEADLMSGNTDADIRIVNTGVAVGTKKESLPVNITTWAAEIVLPSFERMDSVYNLTTA